MRRINYLMAGMFMMMTCATTFSAPAQGDVLRPDLVVSHLAIKGKLVTVYVLNKGKANSTPCFVSLAGKDASAWNQRYNFGRVLPGATDKMVFDISPRSANLGTSLRVVIDSSESVVEMDETNNARELLVPGAVGSGESTTTPAPAPAPPPLLSPDIAAANIFFNDKFVVGVFMNVGVRDYYANDAGIKDSFKRVLTFRRIIHIGAKSYTELLPTRTMGNAGVGQSFNAAYPLPQKIAGATKYTWILTIEGEDPNMKNNTFTKEQQVIKLD